MRDVTSRIIIAIAAALAVWAAYHAVGAYRFNHNPWRAVMVLASMGIFLGTWWLLLRSRARAGRRRDGR
jgi:hypothetical protein